MITLPLVSYASCFLIFLVLLWISKEKQGLRLVSENGLAANLPMLIMLHVAGIFLFGIIPLLSYHPGSFVLMDSGAALKPSTWTTFLLVLVLLVITPRIINNRQRKWQDTTPVQTSPGRGFYLLYFTVRILFIAAYECWFRGYLLTDSIVTFGVTWAILLNIGLYALLHVANGKDDVIACFPFGLLLCSLCIWQGAVWPAVFIHLALTIPFELGYVRKMKTRLTLQL